MTRLTTTRCLLFALLLAVAGGAAACRQPAAAAAGSEGGSLHAGVSPYDEETTDIARVLAGITPARRDAFATLLDMRPWWDYQAESRRRWAAAWAARLQPVREWADAELKNAAGNCQTLLHPYGGTGLLAAYLMFPACEGYVLVGSEAVGQLPAFDRAAPADVAAVTEQMRRAFPGVFAPAAGPARRAAAPASPGALRVLLVQLAELQARIISASRFDLAANGRPLEAVPVRGGSARPAALSLTFEVPGGRPQSLVYLPADLDDASIRRRPALWTFLRLQAPFTTLLAPSAAMDGDRASLLRQLVIDQSRVILQDRPAIPPRLLGRRRWTVSALAAPPGAPFGPGAHPTLAVRRVAAASGEKREPPP